MPQPLPGAHAGAGQQRTLLGVAVPGIAPLNPGIAAAPHPQPAVPAHQVNVGSELNDDWQPTAAHRQRKSAYLLIGAAAVLLLGIVSFLVLWDPPPPLQARLAHDALGTAKLEVICTDCPEGSVVRYEGSEAPFEAQSALLVLAKPLQIGGNDLTVSLERPGMGRDEAVPLTVPVHFRIRADLTGLDAEPPTLAVDVEARRGSKGSVDSKPIDLTQGHARLVLTIDEQLTGASAEPAELARSIPYTITPPEESPRNGALEVRVPIAPLVVDTPGPLTITDEERFMLSGRTASGATLEVAGKPITVDADGAFAQLMSIDSEGETTIAIRAAAKGMAPRTVHLTIKRVARLADEAESFREAAKTTYAEIRAAAEQSAGQQVALVGKVKESRTLGHSTLLLIETVKDCEAEPCLARVVSPRSFSGKKGDRIEVFGLTSGAVAGPVEGVTVPEITAAFFLDR
jgi:hypothetical protein